MKRIIYFLLGLIFGFFLGRRQPARPVQAPAHKPPTHKPPTPRPSTSAPAKPADETSPDAPDDLTEIDGIGPAFAKALNAIGIHTFSQLAAEEPEALAARLGGRVTAARIRSSAWIEQAQQRSTRGEA